MKRVSGFTLLELLVVIGIMTLLATLIVPNYMSSRERARDTTRKSDLRQIQKALELYKHDQSIISYPATLPNACTVWKDTNMYMASVPQDPSTTCPSYGKNYFYSRGADVLTYTLCACLENTADPDSTSGDCDGSYTCPSGKKYVVNEP